MQSHVQLRQGNNDFKLKYIEAVAHFNISPFAQRHTLVQPRQCNDDLKSKYIEAVAHFNFNISPIAQRHTPVQLRPPAVLLSSDFFAGQGCSRAINREVDGIWISPKKNRILYILSASCEKGLVKEVKTHYRPGPQREGMSLSNNRSSMLNLNSKWYMNQPEKEMKGW